MWYLYGVAILAGIATAIQPGQNTQLSASLAHPFMGGLISMTVGALVMLIVGLAARQLEVPSPEQIASVPWWAWGGGFLGTALILAQLFVSHRIGAAPFVGLLVTAGVVTSILLDHFGLIGFDVQRAGLGRLFGGALMVLGVVFVALF